jgi:hypothetical protein
MKFKFAIFVEGAFGGLYRVYENKDFDTEKDAWQYHLKHRDSLIQGIYVVLKVAIG